MTHNTGNCKNYYKKGSLKKVFKKSNGKSDSKMNQNFAWFIKNGFAELTKSLKDKKSNKKLICNNSDSEWPIESGSTGDWVYVENNSKWAKLASYNSPGPIKTTQLSNLELTNHSSLSNNRVTATVAVRKAGPKFLLLQTNKKLVRKKFRKNNSDPTWQWIWRRLDVP